MLLIADDPIVRSIERAGYPPWFGYRYDDEGYDNSDNDEEEEDEEYLED